MPADHYDDTRSKPGADPVIFVVDDDEAVRESLVLLLDSHGIAAKGYGSGGAFLAEFTPTRNGCLVLDLHMPDISGFDLLERHLPGNLDIPVVVISAHADAATRARAMAAGATAVLDKPFRDRELIAAVRHAIAAHQS
jgi:two-component system, LuxR family, response regulator FixJ